MRSRRGRTRVWRGWVGGGKRRQAGSGKDRSLARARLNWASQGQRRGRCKVRRRAERVSRPAREKNRLPQGLGGHDLLARTDAGGPAGEIMRQHLDGQPGAVGGEAARGEMVETHAVLQVPDGVFDLGMAAVVGLQFQGVAVVVGDEGVIAVGGEQGQLGPGRRLHRRTMSRTGAASGWLRKGM